MIKFVPLNDEPDDAGVSWNCIQRLGVGGYNKNQGQIGDGRHRVPAIAYWKGVIHSQTSNVLLMTMDIYPTIAELTDSKIPNPVRLEGRSFGNLLLNKP